MFSKGQQRSSRRFRESTHLIPTPGVELVRPRKFRTWEMNSWVVLFLNAFMLALGIAIEAALAVSKRNNGFAVAQHNVFAFAPVSFLTSFFPTLLIVPLKYMWEIVCRTIRWYQPWVSLAQGDQRVEDTLLLDYHFAPLAFSFFRSFKRRQWVVLFSIITASVTVVWQPLTGALLTVNKATIGNPTTLHGATSLGLIPDVNTLNAFLAAAGFTEAAAFQGLPNPPFVNQPWATAQFTLPDNPGINASVYVNTTGIRTDAGCSLPANVTLDTSDHENFILTAVGSDGCRATSNFSTASASQQYGTAAADPVSCGLAAGTPQQFGPVMFWFFSNSVEAAPQGRAVICRPIVQLSDVGAYVDLNNGSLTDVVVFDVTPDSRGMTGAPFNGSVYNAVLFGDIPSDQFVQARATAIGSQIPGAIFRLASQNATLLQSYFDASDNASFLNLTETIYTEHLAVSAKSVYFTPANLDVPAIKYSQVDRLFVDALAGHALAAVLILIAISGAALHLVQRHQRRNLWLVEHPGTIAAIIALTSHSGFGELLYPYDDAAAVRRKLGHLRFSLDPRTGAVIADEYGYLGDNDSAGGEKTLQSREGSTEKLLEKGQDAEVEVEASGHVDHEEEQLAQRSPGFPVDIPYEHEPLVIPERSPRSPAPPRTPPGKF